MALDKIENPIDTFIEIRTKDCIESLFSEIAPQLQIKHVVVKRYFDHVVNAERVSIIINFNPSYRY